MEEREVCCCTATFVGSIGRIVCHELMIAFVNIRCDGRPFDNAHRRGAEGEVRRVEAAVSRPPGAGPILGPAEGDAFVSFESVNRSAGHVKRHPQHPADASFPRRTLPRRHDGRQRQRRTKGGSRIGRNYGAAAGSQRSLGVPGVRHHQDLLSSELRNPFRLFLCPHESSHSLISKFTTALF